MALRFRELILTLGLISELGLLPAQAQGWNGQMRPLPNLAQTPAPSTPPASTSKGSTFYDRYMQAGYTATNRRDHSTALVYFKRALDERPEDTYAIQAIRNVETYLKAPPSPSTAKPTTPTKPATPAKPATPIAKPAAKPAAKLTPPKTPPTTATATATKAPAAVVVVPSAPPSDAFNEQQAVALINRWLQAKAEVFAPPYDQQQVVDLTTGELFASLVKPDGVLNWLKINRAYFRYGVQNVDSIERFVVARDRATIEVNLTEDRTLYRNGTIDPNQTDFSSQRVRFTFVADNGVWKIADYKTVNGLLLERSILEAASLAR
ncbi:MAG: ARC6/PARC6 family protein [Oscillatoriales cyanobacterium C42_A2020_001]|nr:ARC6/PARC6 family protein [Leptolyngbyaceae cyanobacterium C42_A2020_001]